MTQHSSGPTRWGGKSSVASVESSVICCGIQHDQHGIQLPTEDRVRPRALRRSTGNHCGIPRKQPGIQCPRRSLLIRYGTSDPEAGSTLTQALGRSTAIQCGIQCQEEDRACASTRADPLRSGARAQWREHNPVGAGAQSRSTAIRRGIQRPELSPEGSQRPTRLRYHPTWDPAAGASRRPSRSAAIHPGIQRRREPMGRDGGVADAAWRSGTGRRRGRGRGRPCPRGSGAARVPAPGAHLLLQLLHLLLVRQLRLLQHPPLRRLLLQELDLPAGARAWVHVTPPTHPPNTRETLGRWGRSGGTPGLGCRGGTVLSGVVMPGDLPGDGPCPEDGPWPGMRDAQEGAGAPGMAPRQGEDPCPREGPCPGDEGCPGKDLVPQGWVSAQRVVCAQGNTSCPRAAPCPRTKGAHERGRCPTSGPTPRSRSTSRGWFVPNGTVSAQRQGVPGKGSVPQGWVRAQRDAPCPGEDRCPGPGAALTFAGTP